MRKKIDFAGKFDVEDVVRLERHPRKVTDAIDFAGSMNAYPRHVAELDLDSVQFPSAAIDAMRWLARSRPWRGTVDERKEKLLTLNGDLAAAYGVPAPRVVFGLADERSDRSCYIPALQTIVLRGRNLSVISFTHEWFHHLLGSSEHAVCSHSLALFKRCFRRSWARLRFDGHIARRRQLPQDGSHVRE